MQSHICPATLPKATPRTPSPLHSAQPALQGGRTRRSRPCRRAPAAAAPAAAALVLPCSLPTQACCAAETCSRGCSPRPGRLQRRSSSAGRTALPAGAAAAAHRPAAAGTPAAPRAPPRGTMMLQSGSGGGSAGRATASCGSACASTPRASTLRPPGRQVDAACGVLSRAWAVMTFPDHAFLL